MGKAEIKIKRIYEEPAENDGYRVLVDRLWPRGVSKEAAQLDEWNKKVVPAAELRKWFDHDRDKFEEFSERYKGWLSQKENLLRVLTDGFGGRLTLLYAAKDENHNHAIILKEFLEDHFLGLFSGEG